MKPDPAAFLSWANERWTEQRYNLLETSAQFAAREPTWFLKDFAREWKVHRNALLVAVKQERANLEAACVKHADAIGLAVATVRKHRFRPSYRDCPTFLRVGGKLSRTKLRVTRIRTNRNSDIIKDLVTFSDTWTSALASFAEQPLTCAPIQSLGFPLESREVPDLSQTLVNLPDVQSWPWGGLYPSRLLRLWDDKNKWPDDTAWPILAWGDAFERMLTQLGQLHSAVAMSPCSALHALELTLCQPSLGDYLDQAPSDETANLAGWQLQLQGRYKGWLLAKLGRGNPKLLSHLYPVGLHGIKWHRGPDAQRFLAPMASSLQATIWFIGFLIQTLASRPFLEAAADVPPKTEAILAKAIQVPNAGACAMEVVWTPQGTIMHLGSKALPRQRVIADLPVYVERVLKFLGEMSSDDVQPLPLLKDDASRFRTWVRTHFDIVDGSDPLPRVKGALLKGWHTPRPKVR